MSADMTSRKRVIVTCTPCTVVFRSALMSLIMTFMFEPAKLQMNCARASGANTRHAARADPPAVACRTTRLDPLRRLEAPGPDQGPELLEVTLVLVRVPPGELHDRPVERVFSAQVGGDGDWVAGARVRPSKRPSAYPSVEREPGRHHPVHVRRHLHVAKLAPVEAAVAVLALGPAQEDVAGRLHQPLTLHHPGAVVAVPAPPQVRLQDRGRGLLDLEEERVVHIAALQQDDERPRSDAADSDNLVGHIHDLETLQEPPPVVREGRPVRPELLSHYPLDVLW